MNHRRLLSLAGGFLMLMALGLAVFFFGIEYPKQHALEGPGGRLTEGTIANVEVEQSGRYTGYRADIDYRDDQGRPHRTSATYTYEAFGMLRPQALIPVRYLSADPDYAIVPGSYKAQRNPRTFLLINGGLFAFGLLLFSLPRTFRS